MLRAFVTLWFIDSALVLAIITLLANQKHLLPAALTDLATPIGIVLGAFLAVLTVSDPLRNWIAKYQRRAGRFVRRQMRALRPDIRRKVQIGALVVALASLALG